MPQMKWEYLENSAASISAPISLHMVPFVASKTPLQPLWILLELSPANHHDDNAKISNEDAHKRRYRCMHPSCTYSFLEDGITPRYVSQQSFRDHLKREEKKELPHYVVCKLDKKYYNDPAFHL
jgi:hypothetical protein